MSVSSIGAQSQMIMQQLVQMRSQFDDLQRQLSTGEKADTYAGLGADRGVTVSLNSQLSAINSFDDTIQNVMARTNIMQTALGNMTDITSTVKAAMVQANGVSDGSGAAIAQQTAQSSLDQLLSLLNTQSGNTYLFSGRATNTPAVATLDQILNGDGTQAGLKQLITEQNQADLGSDGLGRLTISGSGSSVQVDEQATTFGLKLASITTTSAGATVSGPTGSPASMSVNFTAVPAPGDTVTMRFNLPDGTSQTLTLTATTNSPPGANEFTIGADPNQTAANFQAALTSSIKTLGATALTAASAVAASNDFFSADANNPPQRVGGAGPPFYAATGMVAGTAANTVIWYTGEAGSDPALSTATARIDTSLTVSYGARANEDGIRNLVQNVATLAAVNISPTDPNGVGLSSALNQRLTTNLSASGQQTVADIESDIAGAQTAMQSAQTRHQQTSSSLNDFLQQIEGVSSEDVGAQLLTLQTRMQASLQITSMLSQISLVNYIK